MLGLSNFASREIDRKMIQEVGLPGLVLMEEAALRIYDILKDNYALEGKNVLIAAGKGNNGVDGLALARILFNRNIKVRVLLSHETGFSAEALIQLEVIKKMGVLIEVFTESSKSIFREADIIIDALLGTGFQGELGPVLKEMVKMINNSEAIKVAIDIPTGFNGDSGTENLYIQNTHTIALGYLKPAHLLTDKINRLDLVKLEFASSLEKEVSALESFNYYLEEEAGNRLPVRNKDTHKGSYGKIGVLGGCHNMAGAAILSGLGALKTGSGLVTLWLESLEDLPLRPPELMLESWNKALNKELDVLILGPGLGLDLKLDLETILKGFQGTVLIDGDGLNLLAQGKINREWISGDLILTPHPKEMERLLGSYGDRRESVYALAERYKATVILKGWRTLISDGDRLWINLTGNPGMGTPGSGDVLSGVIASLKGQGLKTIDSVVLGVYLHGLSGDLAAREIGEASLLASDIAAFIPVGIKKIKEPVRINRDIIRIY